MKAYIITCENQEGRTEVWSMVHKDRLTALKEMVTANPGYWKVETARIHRIQTAATKTQLKWARIGER
jgi:hypothetical protein